MTEVIKNIDEKAKKINKTADKNKYYREYMTDYRNKNKEHIERTRVIATCKRTGKMPSNRAIRLHNFTDEEMRFFLENCNNRLKNE